MFAPGASDRSRRFFLRAKSALKKTNGNGNSQLLPMERAFQHKLQTMLDRVLRREYRPNRDAW